MDAASIYHFLFETAPGIGCLIGGVLVLAPPARVLIERRTRKQFVDREPGEDDWTFFDDDDEGEDGSDDSSK